VLLNPAKTEDLRIQILRNRFIICSGEPVVVSGSLYKSDTYAVSAQTARWFQRRTDVTLNLGLPGGKVV
jgi:hypothetical protein